jgi:hypothetical protein
MDNRIKEEIDITKELCLMLKKIPSVDKKFIFLYMHRERAIKKCYFNKWKKLIR